MSVSPGDRRRALDLFAPLRDVTAKPMMECVALSWRDHVFAAIDPDGTIYLRASGAIADDLERLGGSQLQVHGAGGQVMRLGYWSLTGAASEDPALACTWALRVLEAED
ncbi:MAG: TfoX/Sxy family protein [Rubricella sp.]